MSDITGAPVPNGIPAVARTDRATGVSRDPGQSTTQGGGEKPDTRARGGESQQPSDVRDPAVSISASAAHLQVGDQVKKQVQSVDTEGRPIIVTENATFALRPDAGLKPGDDVVLSIVDTGKTIAADLLVRNGRPFDPPVRLSLVVISVHGSEPKAPTEQSAYSAPATSATTSSVPYSRVAGPSQGHDAPPETLSAILGGRVPLPPLAAKGTTQADIQASAQVHDPLAPRTSSSDLAALINAQQGRAPVTGQGLYRTTTALVPPTAGTPAPPAQVAPLPPSTPQPATIPQAAALPGQPPGVLLQANAIPTDSPAPAAGHLIPPSALTELQAPKEVASGLGPAIPAFSPEGAAKQVQHIDAAISRVPPREVAEVLQVRQLAPDEARVLNLPLSALQGGVALAHVETSKGPLILPYEKAAPLAGELVRITEGTAAEAAKSQPPAQLFTARLTPPGASVAQAVKVALPDPAQVPPDASTAQVKAVHTVRAFLTPEGPKADLRLETTRGMISLTLPNAIRPTPGDPLQIILPEAANPAMPQATGAAIPVQATAAAAAAVTPEAQVLAATTGWPALAAATQTLLATAAPGAAAQLAGRDAAGGAKLTNSLLFFLNAAGRSPESWIGDEAARSLQSRDTALFESLKHDVRHMAAMAGDATPGEWRTALLPLDLRNPDMPLAALLFGHAEQVHPDRDRAGGKEGGDENAKGQRFVVEVRFSILGAVQLDGFIREQQFDLTLRSEKALSPGLKTDAAQLFDAALGANGFKGKLTIAEPGAFPIAVDEIMARRAGEVAPQLS